MCRDVRTAEKFYVALPDKMTGFTTGELRMKALREAVEAAMKDTGSSEEEEPVLSDEPESSDISVSSVDFDVTGMRRKRIYARSTVNLKMHF